MAVNLLLSVLGCLWVVGVLPRLIVLRARTRGLLLTRRGRTASVANPRWRGGMVAEQRPPGTGQIPPLVAGTPSPRRNAPPHRHGLRSMGATPTLRLFPRIRAWLDSPLPDALKIELLPLGLLKWKAGIGRFGMNRIYLTGKARYRSFANCMIILQTRLNVLYLLQELSGRYLGYIYMCDLGALYSKN